MYLNLTLLFAPLLAASISGALHLVSIYFNNRFAKQFNVIAWLITTGFMALACIASIFIMQRAIVTDNVVTINVAQWFSSDTLYVYWGLNFDTLSCLMCVIITFVSFFVYFYSLGYIGITQNDKLAKFISYLSFFSFFMLLLVTSNNFIQMFLGWEGISLFSYFLISFLYHNESAPRLANKAFIVNRVADFAFLLGIFLVFSVFGTLDFPNIFSQLDSFQSQSIAIFNIHVNVIEIICFLIAIAAMGKSAQLFFQVWLPDAMEAPTPVSALLHAATMVTAGVFLIVKLSPIFSEAPHMLEFIAVIGGITAFLGASIGATQSNLKKIIAYSTVSQIGYMFIALGSQFYNGAMFHIFTHAFFKSCLFLCAGIIIHNMHEEQNVYKMGGLWKKMPIVYLTMWVASLALDGIPPFSGYFSKDAILSNVFALHDNGFYLFAYILGVASTFLTAFYTIKLIILVFHGKPEAAAEYHPHKSFTMTFTVLVLGFLALIVGGLTYKTFIGNEAALFWQKSLVLPDNITSNIEMPMILEYLPIILSVFGMFVAYLFYSNRYKGNAEAVAKMFPRIYNFLSNKWYFDIAYNKVFVSNYYKLSKLFIALDIKVFNIIGANLIARIFYRISNMFNKLQTGYFYHYLLVTLLGIFVLLILIIRF
ncbi:NADH-quinone oxidoreductase subunit L [Rickettsiales bacterium LUAb2]